MWIISQLYPHPEIAWRIIYQQTQVKMNLIYLSKRLPMSQLADCKKSKLRAEARVRHDHHWLGSSSSVSGIAPRHRIEKAARRHTTRKNKSRKSNACKNERCAFFRGEVDQGDYFMASRHDHAPHTQRPMQTKISYPRLAPW